MSQFNLFTGEAEQEIISIPEPIEEPEQKAPVVKPKKRKQGFKVDRCRKCDQLIMTDPDNDRDNGLCESCDPRLSGQFDRFKNLALIKALRAHKNIY